MFFSARRERLGGRWMTGVTAGTATATGARVCGVNTHSSSSLSDSESVTSGRDDGDCWSAASTTKGAVAGIMSLVVMERSGQRTRHRQRSQ